MLKVQALNRHQIAVVWLLFGVLIANKVRSMKNNETVRHIPFKPKTEINFKIFLKKIYLPISLK